MSFDPAHHRNDPVAGSRGVGFLLAPVLPYAFGALLVSTDDRIYVGMGQGHIARIYLIIGAVFGAAAFVAARLSRAARERRKSALYKSAAWTLVVTGFGGFYLASHLLVGGSCDAFTCG